MNSFVGVCVEIANMVFGQHRSKTSGDNTTDTMVYSMGDMGDSDDDASSECNINDLTYR